MKTSHRLATAALPSARLSSLPSRPRGLPPSAGRACLVAALLALGVGCAQLPPEELGAGSEALLASRAEPLPTYGDGHVPRAPESCEGRIDGSESFAVTRPDSLVVALRGSTVLCVDTAEALFVELDAIGEASRAATLHTSYYATLGTIELLLGTGPTGGDPNPQPSQPAGSPTEGDPNPQPSQPAGTPTQGDPNPQPSQPAGSPTQGDPNPQPSRPTAPRIASGVESSPVPPTAIGGAPT